MSETRCMVVGSGLMVPCLISTLQSLGYTVLLCGNIESEVSSLASSFGVQTFIIDATIPSNLIPLLTGISVVVSMVPAKFHHFVLKACIHCKVHLVTPSYVSPEMSELEQEAIAAGIVVVNEVGLDPGIDHMSVVHKLQEIRSLGGKIKEFQSSCGAFPAPEACTNIFGYKLAWAPYGALLAAVRPAKILHNGEIVEIPGRELMNHAKSYDLASEIPLSYYPNGDSTPYPLKYGIPEATHVMRCSLRYQNYPIVCRGLNAIGIYDETPRNFGETTTWVQLLSEIVETSPERPVEGVSVAIDPSLLRKIAGKLEGFSEDLVVKIIEAISELGLLSETQVRGRSVFDAFVNLVQRALEYQPGERDCVIMEHKYLVEYSDRQVRYRSLLVEYGVPNGGTSAISRLVSVPTALATDWVCRNPHQPGFMLPMEPQFCRDVLSKLEHDYRVKFQESEEVVN